MGRLEDKLVCLGDPGVDWGAPLLAGVEPTVDVDIDCFQVNAEDFLVVGEDIHRFDANSDGEACETYRR